MYGMRLPELLLKHGTCEADFMTDIYTVNDMGELTNVGLLGGSHAVFAYDETSGDLVILSGHMGIGSLRWFRMENGAVSETNEVSFEIAENETYDDYMEIGYILPGAIRPSFLTARYIEILKSLAPSNPE